MYFPILQALYPLARDPKRASFRCSNSIQDVSSSADGRNPMGLNLQALGRKLWRRDYNRFNIPGTIVSWASTDPKSFSDETSPLSDISRSGLAFLTNNPPTVGSEIILCISLPKKRGTFDVLGRVIYSVHRGPGLTYIHRIGVKFLPFAQTDGCNSLQSLNMIEALELTYGKHGWK